MSTKVAGSVLPAGEAAQLEYEVKGAEFKITKVRKPKEGNADHVPIARIIVADPADKTKVLFGDIFLNGVSNEAASKLVGNVYNGDLDIFAATPAIDDNGVQMKTKAGELMVDRRIRLASTPTCTRRTPNFVGGLL